MMLSVLLAAAVAASPVASEVRAGPNRVLAGTLLQPEGKARAAMIIVPGSGPTDRDGNNAAGVKTASYRKLAEAMAARGVATVRIDKRGMFASAGAGSPNAARFADYDADLRSWIDTTRSATGQKCVWVAGHSEGGLVALRVANAPGVCGTVLLAAPGEPIGTTIRKQLRANLANAPILDSADKTLREFEAGRPVAAEAMHPALAQALFRPAIQGFLIDLLAQDPARLAVAVKRPVLIVQGGHDMQVDVANGEALRKAAPKAAYALFPKMSHVLIDAPAERAQNLATYAESGRPLTVGLADRIAAFVTGGK